MAFLPINSVIGNLKLLDVYDYYDIPRIFSAVNEVGQIFIAINYDEYDGATNWYYLPISITKFNQLKSGSFDIHSAFTESELGYVWDITINLKNGHSEINRIDTIDLIISNLPEKGELLLTTASTNDSISDGLLPQAISTGKESLDLRFKFNRREDRAVAPLRHLGNISVSLQALVDDLSAFFQGILPRRGRLPVELLKDSELCVSGHFVKSFGLHIVASKRSDFFGDSPVNKPIETIMTLFDGDNTIDSINELLSPLGARCASKYRVLLEQLMAADSDVIIEHASPKTSLQRRSILSVEQARTIVSIVKQLEEELFETYIVSCVLTAFNSRTYHFEIELHEDGQRISGKAEQDAIPETLMVVIYENYNATIQETVEVSPITGEKRKKYTLLRLDGYSNESSPNAE